MNLSRQIASLKRESQMAVYQPKRWENVLEDRLQMAKELNLDTGFVEEILEKIHSESIRVQMD